MNFFKKLFGKTAASPGQEAASSDGQISISDFRDLIFESLQEQAPDLKVAKDETDLAILNIEAEGGMSGQSNLNNFHKNLTLFDGSLEEAVQSVIDGVLVAVRPAKTVEASDLLPLIRTAAYLGNASNNMSQIISRPFHGELLEICMADLPTALRGLQAEDLEALQLETPLSTARENMRKLLPGIYRDTSLEFAALYSIEDHAHLAPSLVLFEEFWASADKDYPNGCIIAIPRRDQLFLIDLSDPNAVQNAQHLVRVTYEDDFNLLTPQLFVRKAGVISILDVA